MTSVSGPETALDMEALPRDTVDQAPAAHELLIVAFVITFMWICSFHVFMKSLGGWLQCFRWCQSFAKRCVAMDMKSALSWSASRRSRAVSAKLKAKQMRRVRAGVLFCCFCIGASAVLYFLVAILPEDPVMSFQMHHYLEIAGFWLCFLGIYIVGENPRWYCLLRFPYHLCMLILAVHTMPWSSVVDNKTQLHFLCCLFRFAFLPLATEIFSVAFWSCTIYGFVWYKYPELVPQDAVYTAVTISAYWWLHRAIDLEATLEVEMTDVRSMRRACHKLLSCVCDAVVELDSSMNIAEDVHRLGAWLAHGRCDHLRGQDIQQFLHSGLDRDTFATEVCRKNPGDLAAAFHVNLRDGSGTAIPAECFSAPFESGSEDKHLIAFREFSDSAAIPSKSNLEGEVDIRDDIKKIQMSGGVAVIEFNGMNFETLGASGAFCDKFHGERRLQRQVLDYLDEPFKNQFLQDMTLMSNELLNSQSTMVEAELTLPMIAKEQVVSCFCRLTAYKSNSKEIRFNSQQHGLIITDDEEERVLIKLYIMSTDEKEEITTISRQSSSPGSRASRRSSRSHQKRGQSNNPESGDLRTLNRRSSSGPLPL